MNYESKLYLVERRSAAANSQGLRGRKAGTERSVAQRRRRGFGVYTAEAVIMVLVVGLIFAGVFVGWIIGHYATNTEATKTVTVSASAGSPSSSEEIEAAPNFS